ncbi:hypothetical protein AAE02nite_25970 [Adhaeribacter aerolatus]|uniref:Uncharacterized protein n=1 Tax=Adhaeribacter aerolatus TaxID=670289 RepID=A0A512AYY5_9BACT|nr:hypothetical protein AAE02nite_25970 [Adhaeribacter aerolatus]
MTRFIGKLTSTEIIYKNLFGQVGVIPLSTITKLEQKRSLLSIIREIRLLEITQKTGITFHDENMDEYEINLFTRAFQNNIMFNKIIENAHSSGNTKIRQYTA